jgi:phenylacetic acid degradation operon negative regulatory protein
VTPVTPKTLLLDLLRVAPASVPVRGLCAVGELFGLEENAMRVALTRLCARGLVHSDERGSYRLAPPAAVLSRWVDAWREGERRMRPWQGEWLAVWHPRGGRGPRDRSLRALGRLGFREGRPGLWLRPDNLRAPRRELEVALHQLGLVADAALFVARDFPPTLVAEWLRALWPLAELREGWRRSLGRLETSRARLDSIARERALRESFLVGGEAIRLLALDPLLPDEILDGADRRRLHEAMVAYDRAGRAIWKRLLEAPALAGVPTHVRVHQEAS